MTALVLDARNPQYASADNLSVTCEALFADAPDGYRDITVAPDHPESHARQLFTDLLAGRYGDIAPYAVTGKILNHARAEAIARVNQWRDQQENGSLIFDFDGRRWDCSRVSLDRLSPVVALAKSASLPPGFFWTDAENQNISLNAAQIIALENAMIQQLVLQGFRIHARQRQMKDQINQLTDLNQIRSYQPGWPDTAAAQATAETAHYFSAAAPDES